MNTTTPPPADQPPYPPAGQPPYSSGQPPYPPQPPQPPQPAAGPSGPPRSGSDGFFDAIRRTGLVRAQDRWIGGVASGLALRFGIDPLLVRGILGVSALFGGLGFILYAFAWALLPEQADGRIHLQETFRGHFDAALLGAIGMFIVGTSTDGWAFDSWNNRGFGWLTGLFWVAAIVTVIALLIAAANRRGTTPPAQVGPRPGATGPGSPATFAAPPPPPAGYTTPAAAGGYAGHPAPVRGGYAGNPAPSPAYSGYPARQQPVPPATFAGVPPKPRKPRVYGPGSAAVGAVVGLTLVALAVLLIADRQGGLAVNVGLTAAGIGIVLAGLGIMVAGLRGRSSGALGFLAILGILMAVPVAAITQADWTSDSSNAQFIAPDSAWTPTTLAQARGGITAAVGDLNVDLSELPTQGEDVRVPISLGAGQMTVTVPAGTAVTAEIQLAAGDISWEVDVPQQVSGVTGSRSYDFASDEVTNGAPPALVLELESGAGQIRVVEVDR